mgnify:CR=1 FL=1
MKEEVSALMDGELSGPESEGCIRRLKQDPEAREAWDLYHLVGDVLRGQHGSSLPASFSERLAQEPAVLAPRRSRTGFQRHPAWFALSAAAGVAAVALVGWMALPMVSPPQTQIVAAPAAAPAAQPVQQLGVAPATAPVANVAPAGSNISDYLMAHQRFSPASAMVGVAPYARTVSQDLEQH